MKYAVNRLTSSRYTCGHVTVHQVGVAAGSLLPAVRAQVSRWLGATGVTINNCVDRAESADRDPRRGSEAGGAGGKTSGGQYLQCYFLLVTGSDVDT